MNPHKIDSDELIDRLFVSLRDVKLPQGMEHRIVDVATEHFATRRGWKLALPTATGKSWTLAVASVAIVALGTTWVLSRNLHNVSQRADVRRDSNAATESAQHAYASNNELLQLRPAKHSHPAQRQTAEVVESLSAEDALAISEMNAPSRPAPPLPLTHQERLLAEAVHKANPEELATLTPEVRVRQLELSKAEFHDFFEPPLARDNE